MKELERYYGKFNEEKRLNSAHGKVEWAVSMAYIHRFLNEMSAPRILDIGAGTGRYAVALANEGYDVTAIEPVRFNLGILKAKKSAVKALEGNALDLPFENEQFDLILLFGPLYHLFSEEKKLQAIKEAARVCRPGGLILCAYCMNDYSIISYGFGENHLAECLENGSVDERFHCRSKPENLYDYVRLEDINALQEKSGLSRRMIFSPDGLAGLIRPTLRKLDEEALALFIRYQLSIAERPDMLGTATHLIDVLRKS